MFQTANHQDTASIYITRIDLAEQRLVIVVPLHESQFPGSVGDIIMNRARRLVSVMYPNNSSPKSGGGAGGG